MIALFPSAVRRGWPRTASWLLLLGIGLLAAPARADIAVPVLTARVTDLTGTLSAQQTQQLDAQLAALEQRKGAQIVVLMLPTTQPEDVVDFATRVFDQWKLGRKSVDDGVLVVVAKDDHRAMIETGYGLEGAIPDAAASRIIREYMSPKFRVGDFFGGLEDTTGALTKLIDGEALPPPLQGPQRGRHGGQISGWWILLVIWFALGFGRRLLERVPRALRATLLGAGAGGLTWLVTGLLPAALVFAVVGALFGLVNRSSGVFANHGGFGGWGGGGFGGGGFGGGGFGGGGGFSGGGGGTGGGGASGGW